jgi:hypothetical protein
MIAGIKATIPKHFSRVSFPVKVDPVARKLSKIEDRRRDCRFYFCFVEEITDAKATSSRKNLSRVRVPLYVSVAVITVDNTVRLVMCWVYGLYFYYAV